MCLKEKREWKQWLHCSCWGMRKLIISGIWVQLRPILWPADRCHTFMTGLVQSYGSGQHLLVLLLLPPFSRRACVLNRNVWGLLSDRGLLCPQTGDLDHGWAGPPPHAQGAHEAWLIFLGCWSRFENPLVGNSSHQIRTCSSGVEFRVLTRFSWTELRWKHVVLSETRVQNDGAAGNVWTWIQPAASDIYWGQRIIRRHAGT